VERMGLSRVGKGIDKCYDNPEKKKDQKSHNLSETKTMLTVGPRSRDSHYCKYHFIISIKKFFLKMNTESP
jgi:hypothetical protein